MAVDPGPLRGDTAHDGAWQQLHVLAQRTTEREHLHRPGSSIMTAPNPAGCNLASPGSGTYANVLCFADFTSFTDPSTHGASR